MRIKQFTKVGRTIEVVLDKKVNLFPFVIFIKKVMNKYFKETDPHEGIKCRTAHKLFGMRIRGNLDYVIEWGNTNNSFVISADPNLKSDKFYILAFDAPDLQIEQLTDALTEATGK